MCRCVLCVWFVCVCVFVVVCGYVWAWVECVVCSVYAWCVCVVYVCVCWVEHMSRSKGLKADVEEETIMGANQSLSERE